MKVIVVSDIHDNWANLDRFMIQAREMDDVKTVICCGDVCAPSTLKKFGEGLPSKKIYVVWGNVDGDHKMDEQVANETGNIEIMGEVGELSLAGKKIAFCHRPDKAKKLANTGKYDVVFYGHTHKPWEEMVGKTILLNPGELTYFFYTPTFAIYDLAKMKAKLIVLK